MAPKPPKIHEGTAPAAVEVTADEKLKHVIGLEANCVHALATIKQYCANVMNGTLPEDPDDSHIHRIHFMAALALSGLWNPGLKKGGDECQPI